MDIDALTKFIEYIKSRSTSVKYVAFLDVSKVFDKISHRHCLRNLLIDMFLCVWL